MNYSQAIEFLYGLRLFGAKFGLENTLKLAALAGEPQNQLRFIHVAGTNGKGSTCAMLESVYRAQGLRVGLFTSPHLVAFGERIQINRQLVSESNIVRLVTDMQARLKTFPTAAHPTFFEVVTVMALQYFAEQKCDLVIWETGLGGRLDATNIVCPLASVITNIQFDHQKWLGDTLDKIAFEKAGIIKPGIPVVTATEAPEALAVIQQRARELRAPLALVSMAHTQLPPLNHIQLPLLGAYQRLNAAVALKTIDVINSLLPAGLEKLRVSPEAILKGLDTVAWPARLQLLHTSDGKQILLDGAHNPAGAEVLGQAIRSDFAGRDRVLILGMLADKDCAAFCSRLAPLFDRILLVPTSSDRTTRPADLRPLCEQANPAATITLHDSLTAALVQVPKQPLLVITGSLYLAGEALELLGDSAAAGERGLNDWGATKT